MDFLKRTTGILNTGKTIIERNIRTALASSEPDVNDPIKELANKLHPPFFKMRITDIIDITQSTKTFRFELAPDSPYPIPYFRPGQYVSIRARVMDSLITRPYSIASAPSDAYTGQKTSGYLDLTIRKVEDGFFTDYIWKNWKPKTIVDASGPHGNFYHQPIRDTKHVIGIAGGSGITPFHSMMREIVAGGLDINLTILYGCRQECDIIYNQQILEMAKILSDKIRVATIISEPDDAWKGDTGFITADIIEKYAGTVDDKTFFMCGPPAMYDFVLKELDKLNIPKRRIRQELYGGAVDIQSMKDFPKGAKNKNFKLKVNIGSTVKEIDAKSSESVLVALERAGIVADSRCRSGECGICRSKLISGDVYIRSDNDGRRRADKELGFIHVCASYPVSDLEIKIPVREAAVG